MGDALAGLELLLNAPDKETVLSLMDDAFACRDEGWTQDRRHRVAQELSIASDTDDGQRQVTALYASAVHLVKAALYNDPKSAEDMGALFTDGFHPKLKGGGYLTSTPHRLFSVIVSGCVFACRERERETLQTGLLTKVLGARLEQWREQAVSSPFVTAPRLLEFDWEVHTPSSSASGAAATIRLTVQRPRMSAAVGPGIDRVAVEVDRKTLGEMVGTFVGIRDQLAVMTNK